MLINVLFLCMSYVELESNGAVSGLVSSAHQSSSCVSVGTNTEITGDLSVEGGLNELNIEGALTDELKLLQVVPPSFL